MSVVIYHNPYCSKSRETLQLLQEQGIEPEVVEYLKEPPSKSQLKQLLKLLGLQPRELMRQKEPEYEALGLDDPALSREQLVEAMVAYPKLIERPIVVSGSSAVIGRPPQRALEIIQKK